MHSDMDRHDSAPSSLFTKGPKRKRLAKVSHPFHRAPALAVSAIAGLRCLSQEQTPLRRHRYAVSSFSRPYPQRPFSPAPCSNWCGTYDAFHLILTLLPSVFMHPNHVHTPMLQAARFPRQDLLVRSGTTLSRLRNHIPMPAALAHRTRRRPCRLRPPTSLKTIIRIPAKRRETREYPPRIRRWMDRFPGHPWNGRSK